MSSLDKKMSAATIDLFNKKKSVRPPYHFLSNADLTADQSRNLILNGLQAKHAGFDSDLFPNERIIVSLLFQKTSTRTRCSFEAAATELGLHPMYIDWQTSNFLLASLKDESQVLSRYSSVIVARLNLHDDLKTMADNSGVPVINGMCNLFHPCQALADFMTIHEVFGGFEGLSIAYVGDGNNVARSLAQLASILGIEMRVATPKGYELDFSSLKGQPNLEKIHVGLSPKDAVMGATIVYTDTWVSIGQESQTNTRLKAFQGFTIDKNLFELADPNAIFMHCLPAHRGYEVTDEIMDHPRSVVFEQAENRKHAQKALLTDILKARMTF